MKAIFVELPPFERYREHYMDDAGFHVIQTLVGVKGNGEAFALFTTGGHAAFSSGFSPCIAKVK